jgi:hypothetical protein
LPTNTSTETLVERRAELVEPVEIVEVDGNERGRATLADDRVVEFLERAHGARECHDMRAFGSEAQRDCASDAARGARDDGDAPLQAFGHAHNSLDVPRRGMKRVRPVCAVAAAKTRPRSAAPAA